MTKEEFMRIARQRPAMPEKSVYQLTVYVRETDAEYDKNEVGEWVLPIFPTVEGLYSSRKEAEKALVGVPLSLTAFETVHSAIIERFPLDKEPGAQWIEWWLYDADGNEVDRSVCSAFHCEDKKTTAGKYMGRYEEEIRFQKGEIVEIIGFDRTKGEHVATLGIIHTTPGTFEKEWEYFNSRQEQDGKYPFHGLCALDYFHDFTDDNYGYLSGCGGENALSCEVLKPSLPISKEIAFDLEEYKKAHDEWLRCIRTYDDLSREEVDMIRRGELTEEDIRVTRGMSEYLRKHPGKEFLASRHFADKYFDALGIIVDNLVNICLYPDCTKIVAWKEETRALCENIMKLDIGQESKNTTDNRLKWLSKAVADALNDDFSAIRNHFKSQSIYYTHNSNPDDNLTPCKPWEAAYEESKGRVETAVKALTRFVAAKDADALADFIKNY